MSDSPHHQNCPSDWDENDACTCGAVLMSKCFRCGQTVEWMEGAPGGGWWAHHSHPKDNHDAVYRPSQIVWGDRTTPDGMCLCTESPSPWTAVRWLLWTKWVCIRCEGLVRVDWTPWYKTRKRYGL